MPEVDYTAFLVFKSAETGGLFSNEVEITVATAIGKEAHFLIDKRSIQDGMIRVQVLREVGENRFVHVNGITFGSNRVWVKGETLVSNVVPIRRHG